jgi:hypothetical protein
MIKKYEEVYDELLKVNSRNQIYRKWFMIYTF